jgi:hypothetical protein
MKQQSKSYMLRTGQMRLPVRTIKPVVSVHPIIGEYYMHNGHKVKCIESATCEGCVNVNVYCHESLYGKCREGMRPDGKSVIFIKAD